MYVSARLDYALRALAALPPPPGEAPLTASHLADGQGVSVIYLRTALNDLRVGGLVVHERGPHGGYSLARPAAEISVSEVVAALRILPVEVHTTARPNDEIGDRLTALWHRVEHATRGVLESVTIDDVARGSAQIVEAL
jgi:Rrf2 family protein